MKQRSKTSQNLHDRKSEISSPALKVQPAFKKNTGTSRKKAEGQVIQKNAITSKNCFGDGYSATNPAQEEVREYVSQISNILGGKDSDKLIDSIIGPQENVDSISCDDKIFQENFNLQHENKSALKDEDKLYLNNLKLIQSDPKKIDWSSQNKKRIPGSSAKKKDQTEKKNPVRSWATPRRPIEHKRLKTQNENTHAVDDNKKHKETVSIEPTTTTTTATTTTTTIIQSEPKVIEPKRRKPSEIPLRKNRIDASRKPKAVSMLLEKPVKEEESLNSIDFYLSAKPFSSIDEVSLCSELQITINAISSCEKIDGSDIKIDCGKTSSQENIYNIRLERCYKNANIPFVSDLIATEFLDEKFPGKKFKLIDFEKVKTSSFTVLQTSPSALNRLESFHEQNVQAKKKMNAVNSKKSKPFTTKQHPDPVKRRSSIKSLSSRLSSVKNKSNLKIAVKKSKKEIKEDSVSSEKVVHPKVNRPRVNSHKGSLEIKKTKNAVPESCEEKTSTKPVLNAKRKNSKTEEVSKSIQAKSARPGDKTSPQKVRNVKEKEESKIPAPQKYLASKTVSQETDNSDKSKSLPKSSFNKSKVESTDYSNLNTTKTITPTLTPDSSRATLKSLLGAQKEDDQNSTKTEVLSENGLSSDPSKISYELNNINTPVESEVEIKKLEPKGKEGETIKEDDPFLVVRGTALNFGNEPVSEINEGSTKKKAKMQLKIDLNLQNEVEENSKALLDSCNWLINNDESDELLKEEQLELAQKAEETPDLAEVELSLQETFDGCPLLKGKFFNKMSSLKTKGIRKKIRSDAGDRPLLSFDPFFSLGLSSQNKVEFDTETRNNVEKPQTKKEEPEIFEEVSLKLRRRNSEPISLTGYIWKKANLPIFKGHKPSVSSMASSLRHLNTDDFDDFILWEAVPQKMTSCWEMSLYQLRKPWSVLSCSVFRDNRLSNTPGQILENLRNGGNLSLRQSAGSHSERASGMKANPFDVEPSIAQKNIDIRNWLAALNFPTSSTNSSDVISEGNFTSQPIVDSQNLNKGQATPKRRKVFRNLKFIDKTSKIIPKDKNQFVGRNTKEEENLRDLVRRKSGGFMIKEPLNSKNLTYRFNLNPCLASKSAEEKSLLRETNDKHSALKSKAIVKQEYFPQLGTAESGTMVDDTLRYSGSLAERFSENSLKMLSKSNIERILRGKSKLLSIGSSIWKFLFIFTLFVVIIFYYSSSVTRRSSIYFC